MREALAAAAVVVWTAGAVAVVHAARVWLRAGRRRFGLVPLAGILVFELAWLGWIATGGLEVALMQRSERFVDGWIGWITGLASLAALASGLAGKGGLRDPDRAAEIGVGLFGLGILLRQIATTL
ncbi:hypothetical protein BH20GEM1_BH20GEM1_04180 [soil metagenome]